MVYVAVWTAALHVVAGTEVRIGTEHDTSVRVIAVPPEKHVPLFAPDRFTVINIAPFSPGSEELKGTAPLRRPREDEEMLANL